MDKDTFEQEGRNSEECGRVSRQVMADSRIWEVILVLLVIVALLF